MKRLLIIATLCMLITTAVPFATGQPGDSFTAKLRVIFAPAGQDLILSADSGQSVVIKDADLGPQGDIVFADDGGVENRFDIIVGTADAADDAEICISGGGACADGGRGAYMYLKGEQYTGGADIQIYAPEDMLIDSGDDVLISANDDAFLRTLGAGDNIYLQANLSTDLAVFDNEVQVANGTDLSFADGSGATNVIRNDTVDGADDDRLVIAAGGAASQTRGAFLQLDGNEQAGAGDATLIAGTASGSDIILSALAADGEIGFTAVSGVDLTIADNLITVASGTALTMTSGTLTHAGTANFSGTTKFLLPSGTDLPDSPGTAEIFFDTNDGECDDANDAGGTALCFYTGAAWVDLGGS